MGKFFESILEKHKNFIEKQKIFFVATAPLSKHGHVNVSPKGTDTFRVLSSNKVAYLDLISSGNETSAHCLENGRITIMMCSFEGPANILRLYGKGYTVLPDDEQWDSLSNHFDVPLAVRQIMVVDVYKVQTSCGYGVPFFSYEGERDEHKKWSDHKGSEGLKEYMLENNLTSLDGLTTVLGVKNEK
ncbi:MAG: hypothetical protein RLZZ546_1113 [Bacteroidota bacterium]|jgi:hypothetical protein